MNKKLITDYRCDIAIQFMFINLNLWNKKNIYINLHSDTLQYRYVIYIKKKKLQLYSDTLHFNLFYSDAGYLSIGYCIFFSKIFFYSLTV